MTKSADPRFLQPEVGKRVMAWLITIIGILLTISLTLATAANYLGSLNDPEPLTLIQSITQAARTVLNYWVLGTSATMLILGIAVVIFSLRRGRGR